MKGMLAPAHQEVVIGQAEVRQSAEVSRVGTIAGSHGDLTAASNVTARSA